MSEDSVWEGSCACEAVSYKIQDDQLKQASVCHCKTCQAWSGGVYLYIETKNMTVHGDEKNIGKWMSSEFCERAFCKICGSTLYCLLSVPGPLNGSYHVAAGTLKNWGKLQLEDEIFIDRKPEAYSLQAAGGKPTNQMTMEECYKAWGVPGDDDNKGDALDANETS